jgi:hypothetical protein
MNQTFASMFSCALVALSTALPGAAAAGDFQTAADSFRGCRINRHPLGEALFRSIAGPASTRTALRARYGSEIAGDPTSRIETDFKTATIKPNGPVSFAGVPVSSLAATTCKGGECGLAVYWLNFDQLDATQRRQLKSAADRRRAPGRLEYTDHGAKGASMVCDMGD